MYHGKFTRYKTFCADVSGMRYSGNFNGMLFEENREMKTEKAVPKYMELAKWINGQIQAKVLCPGQKLYSENELREMFGVSRQTVRRALGLLEQEGILRSVRGSGTYINDSRQANLARKLRVSVVTTYVDGYIFPRMIQGIEHVLLENGYSVQIAFTNNQHGRERTILEDILNRDEVAGIVIETTKSALPNPNLPLYREILERRTPILFVNSFYPEIKIPHVSLNDHMAGYRVTKYLIDRGHKKIAGIFKLDDLQGRLRYAGFMEAMYEAGLEVDDRRILWLDTEDIRTMEKQAGRVIDRSMGCTAMFCYNDEVAYGVLDIFKTISVRVPQDISLVSVDNANLATLGEVGLTTVPHPMEQLGQKASENLLRMIHDPFFDANYEFDARIVERDSVRQQRGA